MHFHSASGHLATVLVHDEIADHQLSGTADYAAARTLDQGAQPKRHLLDAERLGDVVVSTRGQPGDLVLHGVLGRQQEHRQLRSYSVQFLQYVQSAHVGQHDVEDDDVGTHHRGVADGGGAVADGGDTPAFVAQHHGDQLAQRGFVIDHEHLDGGTVWVVYAVGVGQSR